jgi:hypothetical protein
MERMPLSHFEEESLTKHSTGKRSPPHANPLPQGGGEGAGKEAFRALIAPHNRYNRQIACESSETHRQAF